jgi:hypothetical protein
VEKTICFAKSGSRSEDKEGTSASRKLDSTLPRLEGDIQDAGSIGGPNLNFIELQRDLVILTSPKIRAGTRCMDFGKSLHEGRIQGAQK